MQHNRHLLMLNLELLAKLKRPKLNLIDKKRLQLKRKDYRMQLLRNLLKSAQHLTVRLPKKRHNELQLLLLLMQVKI